MKKKLITSNKLCLLIIILLSCNSQFNPLLNLDPKLILTLADDLYSNPNITEIDDCTRSQKYLNDIRISLDSNTTSQYDKETYYKTVLLQKNISLDDFNTFRNRLRNTGLRHYFRKGNYSIFVTGGAMGDIHGILILQNQEELSETDFRLNDHYYIWIGKELSNRIYYFSGA